MNDKIKPIHDGISFEKYLIDQFEVVMCNG